MSELRQLRYFVTVAEEGQMTRAASRLHVAQPALSKAISNLESNLGVALFVRHARGMNLTPTGEAFLTKARAALAAVHDAELTARSFPANRTRAITLGFIGPPLIVKAPELLLALAQAHPQVEAAFREMPFPQGRTASWLRDVDVALCHLPAPDPGVSAYVFRPEARVAIVPSNHRLAKRREVMLDDVLDETFISYHPDVQQRWAGFHSLDDHRGGPPSSTTGDRPLTPPEMLSIMTARRGITTVPASDGAAIVKALRGVAAIPIRDADPASVALTWLKDNPNPWVDALVATARSLGDDLREHVGPRSPGKDG